MFNLNAMFGGGERGVSHVEDSSEGQADEILNKATRGEKLTPKERDVLDKHYPGILEQDKPDKGYGPWNNDQKTH